MGRRRDGAAASSSSPRSTSAAPRRQRCASRPGTPTSTSPGASRLRSSSRTSSGPRRWPRTPREASCATGSACMWSRRDTAERGLGGRRGADRRRRRPGDRRGADEDDARQRNRQQRMQALHGGSREDLEVYPNLWAGPGLLRGGAGTALVGSHEQVADRIAEYHGSASTSSSSPAIPTSRRPTPSVRGCCRCCGSAACSTSRRSRRPPDLA